MPSNSGKPRPQFVIVDAPSILGLRPTGVEELPEALKAAGLQTGLDAEYAGRIEPPPYNPERDAETLLLNPRELRTYSQQLAEAVTKVLQQGKFPVVLGGDCSNLIGCALALRRSGRSGLVFIDGHADFYQPEAEPNGEVASMDLAIVSGRGPDVLTDVDGLKPLMHDEDIVLFGYRDAEQQREYGSQDVRATAIHAFDLERVRSMGIADAATEALEILRKNRLEQFWIHLDADVLDDAIMPAVDYRLAGGLSWDELSTALRILMASDQAAGINIGIFNPRLDADGSIARGLVASLIAGLRDESVARVVLQSIVTCPNCGHRTQETMPADHCVVFYECRGCYATLRPKAGHCCVFCSYGNVSCPPVQSAKQPA